MYYFKLVKWNINYKQSILVPVRKITFLGAKWFSDKEVKSKKATQQIRVIWNNIKTKKAPLKGRFLQQIRFFFNYHLSLAGNYFSIINKILTCNDRNVPFSKFQVREIEKKGKRNNLFKKKHGLDFHL